MTDEAAARALVDFLADVGEAPEVVWSAGLAMLERAIAEAKEARYGRFGSYPEGSLRRLREDVARGMKLVRLGAAMQAAGREQGRELAEELRGQAAAAAKARRREQTLPAQLARLDKRRERLGLPTENFHLRADYPLEGVSREPLRKPRPSAEDAGDAARRTQ
jgi:hypothetical protein